MHFTIGAYFQLHFRQFYHGSILYGLWLDCFHQQTELGPYWVTLSGGIREIACRQKLKWNKQLYNDNQYIPVWKLLTSRKAPARSLCHRLGVTAGWSSDVRTILWALQGHRAATLRAPYDYHKSLRSFLGKNDNLKLCVDLTITVQCPYGDRTMSLPCVYGLTIFSNLSLCGVIQDRRGHDARKSVRWRQGLPAEAAGKRWFGHRTGILYSSQGKCNRGIKDNWHIYHTYCILFFRIILISK